MIKVILVLVMIAGVFCNIISETAQQETPPGLWSDTIVAQPQIGADPGQYIVCGFAVRKMTWVKSLWNCNCGRRWYRWRLRYRCNYCDNKFESMTNGFKAIFCHYSEWNNQIVKTFETGNTNSADWVETKCPQGQYANQFAIKTGRQQDTDLGMNGLQLKCSTLAYSNDSLITNPIIFAISPLSTFAFGNFLTGLAIKYEPNGKLTGIRFNAEGTPVITSVVLKYTVAIPPNVVPQVIDSVQVENRGSQYATSNINFAKTYQFQNTWTTSQSHVNGYSVSASVKVGGLKTNESSAESSISASSYSSTTETFAFGKAVTTTFASTYSTTITTPPCTNLTINSVIRTQDGNLPYTALITFSNRHTNALIAVKTVTGIWTGVVTSQVSTDITQQKLGNCNTQSNLRGN